MEYNFDDLVKAAQKPTVAKAVLLAIVAGVRGAGKSTLLGTSGLPTLLLYFKRERHAEAAAKSLGGNIVAIAVDADAAGNIVSADEVVSNIKAILTKPDLSSKFQVLGFDGITVLDFYINQHSSVLKAAKYKDSDAIEALYSDLMSMFYNIQDKGVHVIATIAAEGDADKSTGEYVNVTPELRGYRAVSKVTGAFDDIFCIGKVYLIDVDGKPDVKRMVQFGATFNKSGKRMSGEVRTMSFECRLTGVPQQFMPEDGMLPASIRKLIEFKQEALAKVQEKLATKKG